MKQRFLKSAFLKLLRTRQRDLEILPILHLQRWATWPSWRRMFTAWAVLAVSLAGTFAAWRSSMLRSEIEARSKFEIEAQRIRMAVVDRFDGYEEMMNGMKGLFVASRDVEPSEWRDYVSSLESKIHYPEIEFFGYLESGSMTPKPGSGEKDRLKKGVPILDPSGSGLYHVRYLEPLTDQNREVLGFDIDLNSPLRYALDRARDTGAINLSYGTRLGGSGDRDEENRDSILLFLPVYRKGVDLSDVSLRQKATLGMIFAQFRVSAMMNHMAERMSPEISLRLFEGNQMHPSRLLYNSELHTPVDGRPVTPKFMIVMQIHVLGRSWLMHFAMKPRSSSAMDTTRPNLILLSGLLGSFLLFGMVWSLVRAAHALAIAGNMTDEIRLRDRAMAATENGVLITDPSQSDNPIVYVNSAFERITGYTASEVLGRNPRFLYGTDSTQRGVMELRQALAEQRECRVELRNYRKDGRVFWNELSVSPVRNEECVVTHFVGIQFDITDRKRTEEAMLRVQKLESLGVLAGGIAHDFNNLLAVILGNAELSLKELRVHPARQFVEQIEIASLRGAELCKQMLAYSGKGRFVIQKIQLNEVVQEMTHLLEVSISKKASLEYRCVDELPLVEVDVTQIRQVIMNLVVNASDAIGDHDGKITISTGVMHADRTFLAETPLSEQPEGNYVYLEVMDTGCGMSPETKARIFDPFFTTKFMGRGLGLAALLGIARGHGGTIRVDTELGLGSRFRFLLPCNTILHTPEAKTVAPTIAWQGSGTILVVDDEDDIRTVTARMVESLGFKSLTAPDGEQGVRMFGERCDEIEVVLLDLTMPHMSGEEALREMRHVRADVRVIVMSGYNEEETRGRFDEGSFAGFLQKPFRLNDLRFKLEKAFAPDGAKERPS